MQDLDGLACVGFMFFSPFLPPSAILHSCLLFYFERHTFLGRARTWFPRTRRTLAFCGKKTQCSAVQRQRCGSARRSSVRNLEWLRKVSFFDDFIRPPGRKTHADTTRRRDCRETDCLRNGRSGWLKSGSVWGGSPMAVPDGECLGQEVLGDGTNHG